MSHHPATVLEPFVRAGVFGAAEQQLVRTIARLHDQPLSPEETLALAVALRAPRLGHVGLHLDDVPARLTADLDTDPTELSELPWPEPAAWAKALEASALVHRTDQIVIGRLLPLVWDAERLHLHRYHRHEVMVATDLAERSRSGDHPGDHTEPLDPELTGVLDALLPNPGDGSENRQRLAVERALRRPVTVIAGGPGTGKTHTIARLLVAALSDPSLGIRDVALAAPTGKAAARMTEAVHGAIASLPADTVAPEVVTRLRNVEATTIHSLIGQRPGARVARNRQRPLAQDLIIVDETSMVDLPLLAHLLDAVRPGARIVFVGDPDQLASVGAGTVLADLVGSETPDGGGPLDGAITTLDRVHRFGRESGIAALAEAIRTGAVDHTLQLLDGSRPDLRLVHPDDTVALTTELVDAGIASVEAARSGRIADALTASAQIKVLSAQHRGSNGRFEWSHRIEAAVHAHVAEPVRHGAWYAGRPVLVTRNDRLNRVFNGDTGVTVAADGRLLVALADEGDETGVRLVPPARLAEADSWWAMTIHKSQGSEFPHVVIALPTGSGSPVLTRELLYTAVTRARDRVTIVATPDVVAAAVQRPVVRASGLGPRLRSHGIVRPLGQTVDEGLATAHR